ncbi:hypothetical protein SD70_03945 [Gordoniibacillus kamchatkensis]|uniref:Diguanylate cyclase n=1 Tax=Gordoniibacillus kamchatkensis TaxID=1590651 RepID=A0ABR5ALW4_9BACL|nr:response regulator [Paenibacillus sp. VKM B-2647]KIL42013.1 hypothetical protein SD70_03945 [Paenibacillus sp. VKM B-2647]
MNKYQSALFSSMKQQMSEWFDGLRAADSEDVERFLHSLKGTAGTIGLSRIADIASQLYDRCAHIQRDSAAFSQEELREFLYPLTRAAYDEQLLDADDGVPAMPSLHPASAYEPGEEPLLLVLDDDPTFLLYIREQLEGLGWVVMTTVDPAKAIEYFHDLKPDCFITDLNMPEQSGLEVLAALREKARRQFIPTVVMSGFADKTHRIESYRLGADDYIVKPFEWDEWIVRMERLIERKREVEKVAMLDKLTGAYTRGYLSDSFQSMESRLMRNGDPFSLALVDLDRFKQINDKYGHWMGDQVLERFGKTVRGFSRKEDCVIRYGGEEFVLLLPNARMPEAKTMAKRLLSVFSQQSFGDGEDVFRVTFSAGLVEVTEAGRPLEEWLHAADAALYAAKSGGRNRVMAAGGSAQAAPLKKQLHMTIIDDDAVMRTMLSESLREAFGGGYELEIETYRDGVSYFEQAPKTRQGPAFFLLDGIMPRMDGLEILQRLRQEKPAHPVYIIMLTNRKSDRDIVRALELGADDYLTKPFSMSVLEARIDRLVKRIR